MYARNASIPERCPNHLDLNFGEQYAFLGMRRFPDTYRDQRIANVRRLKKISANDRNHINDYEREIVRRIEFGKTGVVWHVKQVTFSRYVADFYARHIKLTVFVNGCSQHQAKCLRHYGFHVLIIDPTKYTPDQAVEMMTSRAKVLIAIHKRRDIA